ncbi:hypothetical protein T4C_12962 [Trichinella pseudospiralis]|uniref:Uncharacterized protein n=1 Tax=Trichinella pseudospiralis TaxID=6337 RepID=A0A0V1J4W9_TRIPS|nr:hypothetical protein T4C_12962 [Trichinella pseudospiralis]
MLKENGNSLSCGNFLFHRRIAPTCCLWTESEVRVQQCLCGTVTRKNGSQRFYKQPVISAAVKQKCYFCLKLWHPHVNCCAGRATFSNCGKVCYFTKVCRSASRKTDSASANLAGSICSFSQAAVTELKKLLSFVDERLCETLKISPTNGKILMASTSLKSKVTGYAIVDMALRTFCYANFKLHVLSNTCIEVIIEQDTLELSRCSFTLKMWHHLPFRRIRYSAGCNIMRDRLQRSLPSVSHSRAQFLANSDFAKPSSNV